MKESIDYQLIRNKKANALGLLAVLMWSTIATAFSFALEEASVISIIFYASAIAILSLGLILIKQKKLWNAFRINKNAWFSSAVLGFLNPFFYYLILLEAYSLLPAQEALVLNYLWPVSLVILSIPLLGQKISFKSFLFLVVSFSGVMVIATRGDLIHFRFTNLKGDIFAVFSSFIWALYWIINMRDPREEAQKLFINFLFGAGYALVYGIIWGGLSLPEIEGKFAIIWIGLFELGLTFYWWMKAISMAKTTAGIAQLVYLSPFLSLILIHFILGEQIYISTFIGLLLILLGIILGKIQKN